MINLLRKLFTSDTDKQVNEIFKQQIQKPLRETAKSREEDIKKGLKKGDTATYFFIATGGARHGR